MDRGLMLDFYNRMDGEELYDLCAGDSEYVRVHGQSMALGETLRQSLTGEIRERFEEYDEVQGQLMSCLQRILYLKGAEDRERMLR